MRDCERSKYRVMARCELIYAFVSRLLPTKRERDLERRYTSSGLYHI